MTPREQRTLEGRRILLVEDADDAREAFGTLLGMEGAGVVSAATGREALHLLERGTFDALVTDLGLPDIPGDLLIRQAVDTVTPRPLIIAVTGYSEPYARRAREAGADEVLTKPIEWPMLLRLLQQGVPVRAATRLAA